ncbi:deaminase [Blattabacterium cuenoti]|uniref:deaminase n=1 Tax=Blattabacterium cuenoti TaxID=1653831 RepID=UPI00293BB5D4|nr:deaminase [Blattabacterium cuenoti]
MSFGFNKTPNGFPHSCEDKNGNTNWYVIHAEANAILKIASNFLSCEKSTIYITHFPCKECCKLIYLSKIKKVIYLYYKNNHDENDFLNKLGIIAQQLIW